MADPAPKFTITNNHLAMGAALWMAFTQARDAISSWALRNARDEGQVVKVATLENGMLEMRTKLSSVDARVQELQSDLDKTKGDLKAETSRSYEAGQSLMRTVDDIKAKLDAKPVPAPAQ